MQRNTLEKVVNVYTYLIERQMVDSVFNIPSHHYFKILDVKYPEDAEVIKDCIMYRLKHRYDEETIAKDEDECGAMVRQTYSELCNLRKALDNDYGENLIALWQRCLPDLFRSVNGLKEIRKRMEARGV